MPTGAELKARASVAATGMKRNLFNREKPDKPVKPRQSSPSRLASGMSDLAARVGSLFRGGGGLDDEEANPMDKMAAMRLVDAGLWEAREVDALYKAFNRIRAKDGHRRKATNSAHNAGGRGLFDGTKPVDKKLDKVMEGLDCNASGFVSRDEFLSFSHRHHHLLLPAFGVQRSAR
ncbi:hypothetical protein JL720_15774 [Aureococcus anophagefferens]|nr:hypothetical protein JL720_15774 [Aureococcus anophagefferens]